MGIDNGALETVGDLLRWCRNAPEGTRLEARVVAEILDAGTEEKGPPEAETGAPDPTATWTWRERLWVVPAETRLGTEELAEALGRPKSWVYSRTQSGASDPIPHRKLDGSLWFAAGEVRAWIREREEVPVGGPMESTDAEKRLGVLEGGAA